MTVERVRRAAVWIVDAFDVCGAFVDRHNGTGETDRGENA